MRNLIFEVFGITIASILLVVIGLLVAWAENDNKLENDKHLACEHFDMVYVNPNGGDGYCSKGVTL